MNAGHGGPNDIHPGGAGGLGAGASHQQAHHPAPGQNHFAPHLMAAPPNMTMEPPPPQQQPHLAPNEAPPLQQPQQNNRAMAPVPPPYPGKTRIELMLSWFCLERTYSTDRP